MPIINAHRIFGGTTGGVGVTTGVGVGVTTGVGVSVGVGVAVGLIAKHAAHSGLGSQGSFGFVPAASCLCR